jgi:acyl-coenzyme A synthetase/AMP-(fatty) acid ligase
VASLLPKDCGLVVAVLGTWKARGVFAPLDPALPPESLRQVLALLDPVLVLGSRGCVRSLRRADWPGACLEVDAADAWWEKLSGTLRQSAPDGTGDDPAYVNFTSGSMGTPKAVLATQNNVIANAAAAVAALGLSQADVHLCLFPGHLHPHEIFARGVLLGGTSVVIPSFRPGVVAGSVARWGVTALMAAPFFYELAVRGGHMARLGCVRVAEAGGAVSATRLRRAVEKQGGARFVPVWGSTETTGVALAPPQGRPLPDQSGFVGEPCPGYEARMDAEELLIRGEGVALGYLAGPGLRVRCWGEWFRTNDCFEHRAGVGYRFVGRKNRMIKVAGRSVHPAEIEASLRAIPSVLDCAVVGIDDPLRTEVPAAAVVVDGPPDPRALARHCRSSLGPAGVPRSFVFPQDLPRTASGKIDLDGVRRLF